MEELQVEVGGDEVGEHGVVVVLVHLEYLLVVGLHNAETMLREVRPQVVGENIELEGVDQVVEVHDARLGLEVLLEMHDKKELEYCELQPDVYGINNRHLGSFVTDVETSFRLAELLPKDAVKVSESGISSPETIRELRQAGFRGFLIGETFMKTPEPGKTLGEFIQSIVR
ncbi:MAG: hypothetical protein IKM76_07875, partial [Prevotella sp.]|nr:hypothetical protein [Prevotella sp.]